MKRSNYLTMILFLGITAACSQQQEVLLKDCNAFGGIIRYKDELFTGKVKDIRDGKLHTEFTVNDGKPDGDYIKYYSDGKTKSSVSKYSNGSIIETIYYDKNGKESGRD
jgi:hypothetical protein